MREQIRDRSRLEHILDAIEKASEFTGNVSFEEMRHILVHGYYQTEDKIVWDTVKYYLPLLKEKIIKII